MTEKDQMAHLPLLENQLPAEHQARLVDALQEGPPPADGLGARDGAPILDVRSEAPARRHELIFEWFADLAAGDAYVLVNDHDPKPLYYQFAVEHAGQFTWRYLEQGPEVWRVELGRAG